MRHVAQCVRIVWVEGIPIAAPNATVIKSNYLVTAVNQRLVEVIGPDKRICRQPHDQEHGSVEGVLRTVNVIPDLYTVIKSVTGIPNHFR